MDRATSPGDIVRLLGASPEGDPGDLVVLMTGGLPGSEILTVSSVDPTGSVQNQDMPASAFAFVRTAAAQARRIHRQELERVSALQASIDAARKAAEREAAAASA